MDVLVWSSYGPEDSTEESVGTSTFSEEELLDITFEACNTTGTGEVLASTIMQYLQTMTSQSPEQDRLNALNRMLDPECRDPAISRAKFQSTMREWIAQCSQDGMHEDDKHISGENPCKVSINGKVLLLELLATVSELKHAHSRMSKQNNSLLRTVSQGEDTNLQLTVEITELSAKLARYLCFTWCCVAVIPRFDRHCGSPTGFQGRSGGVPNHRSLHAEIQDIQQVTKALVYYNDVFPSAAWGSGGDDWSSMWGLKGSDVCSITQDSVGGCAVETLERPYPHSQQPQPSIKQQLVNVYELEQQMTLWEEREEKVAEQRRLQEQQEQRQKPQAKRAAVVNWWRTLKVEGGRTKPSKTLTDTDSKLQQAKHTITKIREQVCHLESALRTAQEDVAEHKYIQDRVGVLHKDKKTNTVREGPGWTGEEASKERKDVAVATDHVEDPGRSEKVAAQLVTSEGLLVTLRRMEAMVSIALEAAELVRESQRRVSQVKERMESITQKMEEALTRGAHTEDQLSALEARVTAKPQVSLHSLFCVLQE
ncbi:unnamed protein product [Oncorhynchus mykiss]|uniref:Protein KASH5 EF-hand-like domain-containing protein n=1 Tax=Oncorhynchus mykiss TaxID=8022 RepID=A0A060W531_ONCMY|nr:unnamed protein product [Oncorhynchus mykiss]